MDACLAQKYCIQLSTAATKPARRIRSASGCSFCIKRYVKQCRPLHHGSFVPKMFPLQCHRALRSRPSLADHKARASIASDEEETKRQNDTSPTTSQQDEKSALVKYAMPSELSLPSGVVSGVRNRGLVVVGSSAQHGGGVDMSLTAEGYLRRILTSSVYDVAIETPLEEMPKLSKQMKNLILLKREDMQSVFSFKLRGAYNKISKLSPEQRDRGVICSSAGNHAQGVAMSAKLLGINAIIAMPVPTPAIKVESVRSLGAQVELVGDTYDDTQAYAKERAEREGMIFIPPFDDPDVIAGQGTVGMEILRQRASQIHAIFIPIGGGGLIAGVAAYVKRLRPEIRVIGVEPSEANAMAQSLQRGFRVTLKQVDAFADGVAVKSVGAETFRLCQELVDGVIMVSKAEICDAIKIVFQETRSILEPAGAVALAGAKAYARCYGIKDETFVVIASGANMNFDRLRLISELASTGGGGGEAAREAILTTEICEEPGSFMRFVSALGEQVTITEFKYRYSERAISEDGHKAHVMWGVSLEKGKKVSTLISRLHEQGMPTMDLSADEFSQEHLRHLVGGNSLRENERLFRFNFPERPGALRNFLQAFSPRFSISMFQYRALGEQSARVIVGFILPGELEQEFKSTADELSYPYWDESENKAFKAFFR